MLRRPCSAREGVLGGEEASLAPGPVALIELEAGSVAEAGSEVEVAGRRERMTKDGPAVELTLQVRLPMQLDGEKTTSTTKDGPAAELTLPVRRRRRLLQPHLIRSL